MNPNDVVSLERVLELFDEQRKPLRIQFNNGDVFDLRGFAVAQDIGEDHPHCTSTEVIQVIAASPENAKLFNSGIALMFQFDQVANVETVPEGKLIFSST